MCVKNLTKNLLIQVKVSKYIGLRIRSRYLYNIYDYKIKNALILCSTYIFLYYNVI